MLLSHVKKLIIVWIGFHTPQWAYSLTANKVWFEFRGHHGYRVLVNYTVPALKEFREAYIDFQRKSEAEAFYWDLVRGADFYLTDPKLRRFVRPPQSPEPW